MIMIDCPKCKASIENDSWFCDQCGQELKVCPQCTSYGKGNRCTQCGTVLVTAKEKSEANATPPPAPVAPSPGPETTIPVPAEVMPKPASGVNVESTIRRPEPIRQAGLVLVNAATGIKLQAMDGAVIGRRSGPYAQLLSSQGYISGTHARFDFKPDGWTITDLDSTNGTFVNNVQLRANVPCALSAGARVLIADLEFIVNTN